MLSRLRLSVQLADLFYGDGMLKQAGYPSEDYEIRLSFLRKCRQLPIERISQVIVGEPLS